MKYFFVVFLVNSCISNGDCCDQLLIKNDCNNQHDNTLSEDSLTSHNTSEQNVKSDFKKKYKKTINSIINMKIRDNPHNRRVVENIFDKVTQVCSEGNITIRDEIVAGIFINFDKEYKDFYKKLLNYYNNKINTFINDNVIEKIDLLSKSDEWVFNRLVRYIKD